MEDYLVIHPLAHPMPPPSDKGDVTEARSATWDLRFNLTQDSLRHVSESGFSLCALWDSRNPGLWLSCDKHKG